MTVGEKIQLYRKQFGLSQEELGQKLSVSRQTISLWEKGQTLPSIDNLIRLKEIFDVSIDEILDCKTIPQEQPAAFSEAYSFNYTAEDLREVYKSLRQPYWSSFGRFLLLLFVVLFFAILLEAPNAIIGIFFGMLVTGFVQHIKNLRAYKNAWKKSQERIVTSRYVYRIDADSLHVQVLRDAILVRTYTLRFSEIEQCRETPNFLILFSFGQVFLLRKSELTPDSALYKFGVVNRTDEIQYKRWKWISRALVAASVLSIFAGIILTALVSPTGKEMFDSMWVYYLFTPIPIASFCAGLIFRKKGYPYKKNLIAGIIFTLLLCVYGSYPFIFGEQFTESTALLVRAEQYLGTDFPAETSISTSGDLETPLSNDMGYVYGTCDLIFDIEAAQPFEQSLPNDDRWRDTLPNDLLGITPSEHALPGFDYILIYNSDSREWNTQPAETGTYHFTCIYYRLPEHQMRIVEYSINYQK